jgi:hypothetical protein
MKINAPEQLANALDMLSEIMGSDWVLRLDDRTQRMVRGAVTILCNHKSELTDGLARYLDWLEKQAVTARVIAAGMEDDRDYDFEEAARSTSHDQHLFFDAAGHNASISIKLDLILFHLSLLVSSRDLHMALLKLSGSFRRKYTFGIYASNAATQLRGSNENICRFITVCAFVLGTPGTSADLGKSAMATAARGAA